MLFKRGKQLPKFQEMSSSGVASKSHPERGGVFGRKLGRASPVEPGRIVGVVDSSNDIICHEES